MNPIRPNLVPPGAHGPQGAGAQPGQDAGKLAAQRAFFAALGKAEAPAAPAAAAAAPAPMQATAPAPARTADPTQKILRPGSLIDIRV